MIYSTTFQYFFWLYVVLYYQSIISPIFTTQLELALPTLHHYYRDKNEDYLDFDTILFFVTSYIYFLFEIQLKVANFDNILYMNCKDNHEQCEIPIVSICFGP